MITITVVGVILVQRNVEPVQKIPMATGSVVIAQDPASMSPPSEVNPPSSIPEVPPPPDMATPEEGWPPTAVARTNSNAPPASARARTKPPLHDPMAREALAPVGLDPQAEAYWLDAIYDTSLPDEEREDLMEDLNQDGLSDYKRPGPWDLPLIINRLFITEEVAPYADEFMLPHLSEAYKDLVNLAEVAQGGGEPVR